jgi:hypothetical protein
MTSIFRELATFAKERMLADHEEWIELENSD